jgi:uncharacterized membrane protein YfcA
MGIQTAATVALGVHAVFTTAATATWAVLVGDAAHWSATQIERRRLSMVLAGVLLGALAGSQLMSHMRVRMPLLPLSLTLAVAAAARAMLERCEEPRRTGVLSASPPEELRRTGVSSASRPVNRAFGRSPSGPDRYTAPRL